MATHTDVVYPATNRPVATREATDTREYAPAPSKAAIAGHPIHPMLIPFPVTLLAIVPITDIVYLASGSTFWSSVSYYSLWAGLITAGLAALFGLIDFVGVSRVRTLRAGWAHMLLNVAVVALSVVNLLLRRGDTIEHIEPSGLILSLVTFGLLLCSGWYGGELAYRYKIGVNP